MLVLKINQWSAALMVRGAHETIHVRSICFSSEKQGHCSIVLHCLCFYCTKINK